MDASINCQACHGRGDEHVKAWKRLSPDAPMPRLEDLTPRAKTGVCARCHGGPSAEAEFQPSDAAYYIGHLQDRPGLFPDGRAAGLTYQQPSFVRSLCHAKGGLSCTDCHDAHGNGLRKGADTDALCVRCHPGLASREHTFHEASGAGARCIECHMPRLLTGLMAHQHDHRIGIPLPAVEEVPDACTACHKDKTKGWADAAWRARWGEPPAATIEAVRGIVLMRAHDPAAGPLLRAALTSPDPYFRANAIRGLDEPAAGLDDPVPEVRFVAFEVAAASPKHAAVLRKFLQDPEPVIRGWCEAELATRGTKPDPSWRADLEIAVRLSRGWGPGNVTLGMLRLWAGDAEGAVSAFRAAATYSPAIEDAWAGLSRSLHTVGRHAEADAVEAARTEAWRHAPRPVRR